MSNKKHIDQLYKEKLKSLKVAPSDSVWKNINTELQQSSKTKKPIPLWIRLSGLAAGLALFYIIGNSVFNTNESSDNVIVDTENSNPLELESSQDLNEDQINSKEQQLENILTQDKKNEYSDNTKKANTSINKKSNTVIVEQQKGSQKNTVVNNNDSSPKEKREFANNTKLQDNREALSNETFNLEDTKTLIKSDTNDAKSIVSNTQKENSENSNNESLENKNEVDDSLSNAIAEASEEITEEVNEKEANFSRWSVSPTIAPVYFNSLSSGSSIHSQFNNNSKTGNVNMSFGVSAAYAINDKLSVRAGVNKVNLGYSTNDVVVYNNIATPAEENPLKNIAFNEVGQNMSFISADEFAFSQVPGVLLHQIKGSIDQELGFIEIPLEIAYKLTDKKLSLNIIGGFSALFLNKNEVYSVLDGQSTLLGKATNINKMSYSANLGLGLDLNLSEKFNLNLEPTFKYQLNTFNNTSGNFKPYFIGVYSGLKFKF